MNELLTVLSHHGQLGFQEAYRIIDLYTVSSMNKESNIFEKMKILRMLEELGHCEIDVRSRKIYCNQPFLSMLPGFDNYILVLTGARSNELVKRLSTIVEEYSIGANINIIQTAANLPDVIYVQVDHLETANHMSEQLNIEFAGFMPISICKAMGDMSELMKTVDEMSSLNWSKRIFSIQDLYFKVINNDKLSSSFTLEEYTAPYSQEKIYRFVIGDIGYRVDREWGRYLFLNKAQKNILFYDHEKNMLMVPCTVPLPRLFARAATLCSGKGAIRKNIFRNNGFPVNCEYEMYENVPRTIAEVIASKVGQKLLYST